MLRRASIIGVFISILVIAPSTSAQTLSPNDISARILELLTRVQELQTQLQRVENTTALGPVQGVLTTPSPQASANPTVTTCAQIPQTLAPGDTGEAVRVLQEFLARDVTVYPERLVSGYYGARTQSAVARWQARAGIVSEGTPETTGFGAVGPQTRTAMNAHCATQTHNPAIARPLVVTPEVGQLPLEVVATFSLAGSSCSSFALDWGDGTIPLVFDAGSNRACTRDIAHKRAIHTYETPGVHRITLRAGHDALVRVPVVDQTLVSVGARTQLGVALSPESGSAPFTTSVTFPVQGTQCTSYEVNWGDGTIDSHNAVSTTCDFSTGTQALSHTYESAGTYRVTLKTGRASVDAIGIVGDWEVVVRDDITTQASVDVAPTRGIAPLRIEVRIVGEGERCTSYEVNWGDGTSGERFDAGAATCNDGNRFEHTFEHTYERPGNYLLTTTFGRAPLGDLAPTGQVIRVE